MIRLPLSDVLRYADRANTISPMRLHSEIADWCEEQFSYVPEVHEIPHNIYVDGYGPATSFSYEVELRSERDAIIFKLQW